MAETSVLNKFEFRVPWAKPELVGNEGRYVAEAIASNWISGGPFVDRFEREFADICGSHFAVTASNGTAALHMAYLALGIAPGDEVIVPGFAFMAAANVAMHLGAKPLFTDVDPHTWCMTASAIGKLVSSRTKLIVPIHTYGGVCPMDEILDLAQYRSVPVLEDAAEAFGSRYKHGFAGTFGLLGAFSFHATKTITTGEGGMIVTDSPQVRDKLNLFRNHGMDGIRYWHKAVGHNFRMTNMQAAMGCAQLEQRERIFAERRRVYACYRKHLSNVAGVTMQDFAPQVTPLVWAVAVKLDAEAYPQGRDNVMRQLLDANVETRNGFYAASLLPHLYQGAGSLPVCEHLSRQIVTLPSYSTLQDSDIESICLMLKQLRR